MKAKMSLFVMLFAGIIAYMSCSKKEVDSSAAAETTSVDIADAMSNVSVAASCNSYTGIDKIICLADALKALLTSSQLAKLQLDYSVSYAKRWSNFPEAIYGQRVGLSLGSMNKAQLQAAAALIKAVAGVQSNEGYDELIQLLYADDYLGEHGGGNDYGYENFYLAFLGEPAENDTFEIQYGGHHTAFANTYENGELAGATPSFRGVEPFATFSEHNKTCQPIQQEQSALSAMLTGLTTSQLAAAKLSGTYSDLIAGPQKDDNFPSTPSGIACSNLSSAQKTLVLKAIKTYVDDIADSSTYITKYSNELGSTYISYSGTTGVTTKNDYVRIDGPSLWIEYSVQNGVVLSGTHPHSVWRDKTSDYGGNN